MIRDDVINYAAQTDGLFLSPQRMQQRPAKLTLGSTPNPIPPCKASPLSLSSTLLKLVTTLYLAPHFRSLEHGEALCRVQVVASGTQKEVVLKGKSPERTKI